MRLLYLARSWPPETWGGVPVSTSVIARNMVRAGHEVHALVVYPGASHRDEIRDGVNVHWRPQIRAPRLVRRVAGLSSIRRVGALVAGRTPVERELNDVAGLVARSASMYLAYLRLGLRSDVVESPDADGLGLWFAWSPGVRLVVNLRCPPQGLYRSLFGYGRPGVRARIVTRLEHTPVRRAQGVTSASARLVAMAAAERSPARLAPRVVHHTIDEEAWSDLPDVSDTGQIVLAVGRLEAVKSPETIVHAMALLHDQLPGAELIFVGASNGRRDGVTYAEWVADLASRSGVACQIVDHVDRAELRAWYGRARVVVIASRWDTFPVTGLEAMAAARPVVCTTEVGLAEFVSVIEPRAVVEPDDRQGLADILQAYLEEPALAADHGARARAVLDGDLSVDRVTAAREALYGDVINSRQV